MKSAIISAITFCVVFALGWIVAFLLGIRYLPMSEWSNPNYAPYITGLILGIIAAVWTYRAFGKKR